MENCEESNNKCTQHPGISCLEMSAFDQLWYQYVSLSRSRGFSAQLQERKLHEHLPIKIDSLAEEYFLQNNCELLFFLRLKSIKVSLHDCETARQAIIPQSSSKYATLSVEFNRFQQNTFGR